MDGDFQGSIQVALDDLDFGPDLLFAEVVETPHAHAIIKRIDTSKAEALPGVVRVVTGADFPFGFGLTYSTFRYDELRLSAETMTVGK